MKKLTTKSRLLFEAVSLAWIAFVVWTTRDVSVHTMLGFILGGMVVFGVQADYQQFQECYRAARFRKALWKKISNDSDLHPAFQSEWEDET